MTFLGSFLALLWDQLNPLYRPSQFDRLFGRYADWLLPHFNAGTRKHGYLAWAVAALLPALLAGLTGVLLGELAALLGMAWSALVLYQCMGFRRLTHLADEVKDALLAGDEPRARARLLDLGLAEAESVPAGELNRRAVEHIIQAGLGRVFGVLFWFMLFGPFGAVAYALSVPLAARWSGDSDFHTASDRIVAVLDWLPSRLLAFSFAIVGNFEEAMLRWRALSTGERYGNVEVLLASGFGALGLDDDAPDADYVSGAAALLKRSALVWLAVLGLLWLGGL
jgi:adenosylcobinamide-phosphate synthase